MIPISIVYITSRENPEMSWFLQSLESQIASNSVLEIIVVDYYADREGRTQMLFADRSQELRYRIRHVLPKPTIWQGAHKVTREDWWGASNARNTGLCLAQSEWVAFVDDRCVLAPTWYTAVCDAIKGGYAVCGAYEKRHGMKVNHGVITHGGIITGMDGRLRSARPDRARVVDGGWWYGCTTALRLKWAFDVNGYEEACDGMSFEDIIFGQMLNNSGVEIRYDPRMAIIEDRTPDATGKVFRREDKGVSPLDKSHECLKRFGTAKRAVHLPNNWNLAEIRKRVLMGGEFPIPDVKEPRDWYDGQLVSEMG